MLPVTPNAARPRRAALRTTLALALAATLAISARAMPPVLATAPRAEVRPPAVADQFYPSDAGKLEAAVKGFLADALPSRGERPLALVVPHAGYIYSGQIAADGWRQAMGQRYDLVVILGVNHTTPGFSGVSVYTEGGFRTPLGVAGIDAKAAAELLAADRDCTFDPKVHEREHSIEVHVPFVQVMFPGAKILPVVMGSDDPALCARLGRAVARVASGRRALIVASSDLAHYPAYDGAVASDRAVLAAVARLDARGLRDSIAAQRRAGRPGLETCACGEAAILAVTEAAKALGATRGVVISRANSGDAAVGERDRVVGYGAVMFTAGDAGADLAALDLPGQALPGATLGPADQRQLLAFARRTIERWFATQTVPLARGFAPAARRPQGAFVTLLERGELRGCIGRMQPDLPLAQVVGTMALGAAFQDPRFPPLEQRELADVEIEISALTPLTRIPGPEAIQIGRDGVEIRKGGRTAVFLPEVPVEQGWDRNALLEHLCLKAGLPKDAWKRGAEFYAFRSVMFRESRLR